MLELDIRKFLDELFSMLQNKKNTRSIRLSIKRCKYNCNKIL